MTTGGSGIEPGGEELPPEILERRICDFELQIEGRALEGILSRFRAELEAVGITQLKPTFYLSDEWGVPEGTVAIGIPFYLADDRLLQLHGMRGAIVEGDSEQDILRYLRHEMGHVVNYAYRLFATEEWTALFGEMSLPYEEEYRVVPFSPDFVRHLPGSYAQKHPDEDWAETFAVWMTPGLNWRERYADASGALRKLEYCERTMARLRDQPPLVTTVEIDDEVRQINTTLHDYYAEVDDTLEVPRSLDGDLQVIFRQKGDNHGELHEACDLLRRHQRALAVSVYHWTAVPPEFVLRMIDYLISRAQALSLCYPASDSELVLIDVTAFLTMLASAHKR